MSVYIHVSYQAKHDRVQSDVIYKGDTSLLSVTLIKAIISFVCVKWQRFGMRNILWNKALNTLY